MPRPRIPEKRDVTIEGNFFLGGDDAKYDIGKADKRVRKIYVKELVVSSIVAQSTVGTTAINADTVDLIHASTVATANKLLALNASGKLPASITGDAATVDGYDAVDFLSPSYVVMGTDSNLTLERVLTAGDGLDLADGGAGGNATLTVDVTDFIDTNYGLTESSNNIRVNLGGTSGLEFSSGALQIDDAIAGAGLSISSKILAVGDGDGIVVSANSVAVGDGDGIVVNADDVAVGAGDGITVNADDVALTTPGTLDIDSTNASAGNHTHEVAGDYNPGANDKLLETHTDGGIQLLRLGIGAAATDDNYIIMADGGVIGAAAGPRIIFDDSNDYFEFIAGDVGIRTNAPAAALDVYKDTVQIRTTYASDDTKYAEFYVGSSGSLEIDAIANIYMDPGGNAVLGGGQIEDDLGAWNHMWRTLFVAELYAQTIVAQDVMATIGGRILVAPTTYLTSDLGTGVYTIEVEHNNLAVDDYVYMAASPGGVPQIEAMQIATGPTGAGPYEYTVTAKRNLDGTGENNWVAGDAVVHLGQGYIDLTSTATIHQHLGPTITIYDRTATTNWDDVAPVVAVGNLDSYLGFTEVYGIAMGNDISKANPTAGDFYGATLDATNGLQLYSTNLYIYDGATPKIQIINDEGLYLSNDTLDADTTTFAAVFNDSGQSNLGDLKAGDVIIGVPLHTTPSSQVGVHWDDSASELKLIRTDLSMYDGATQTVSIQSDGDAFFGSDISAEATTFLAIFGVDHLAAGIGDWYGEEIQAGDIIIGNHAAANMMWDKSAGRLNFRGGTTVEAYVDTDGSIAAGGGTVVLDVDGITIDAAVASQGDVNTVQWDYSGSWLGEIYAIHLASSADELRVRGQAYSVNELGGVSIQAYDHLGSTSNTFTIYHDGKGRIDGWLEVRGGLRIGTTAWADPGNNNLIVDGTSLLSGAVTLTGDLNSTKDIRIDGGLYVGNKAGTIANNNLVVDGTTKLTGITTAGTVNAAALNSTSHIISSAGTISATSSSDQPGYFYSTDDNAYIQIRDNSTQAYVQAKDSVLSLGHSTTQSSNSLHITTGGRVGVGSVTAPGAKLEVSQGGSSAAISVLSLKQSDVDKAFIAFTGTAASANLTRSIVDSGDVSTWTIRGGLKLAVVDIGNQIADQSYYIPIYTIA